MIRRTLRMNAFGKPLIMAAAFLLPAFSATQSALGQCEYDITALVEGPPCLFFRSILNVLGMNNHGHVVGFYKEGCDDFDQPFVWTPQNGVVTLPVLPGFGGGRALAISDAGDIAGYLLPEPYGANIACVWRDGQAVSLGTLPGDNSSVATGISNDGTIVGSSHSTSTGTHFRAVRWRKDVIDVIDVPLGPSAKATDISANGRFIAGWMGDVPNVRTFLWRGEGDVLDLGHLPGGSGARPEAVNNRGHVAGFERVWDPRLSEWIRHAFLWRGGRMTDLGPPPRGGDCDAYDVNDLDQVVGVGDRLGGFIWIDGTKHALLDLIPALSAPAVIGSYNVNNAGQIAGEVWAPWMDEPQMILLTPAPGPPGDVTIDCRVNVLDLLELLRAWGPCPGCRADLNSDGVVDAHDLQMLLKSWG